MCEFVVVFCSWYGSSVHCSVYFGLQGSRAGVRVVCLLICVRVLIVDVCCGNVDVLVLNSETKTCVCVILCIHNDFTSVIFPSMCCYT